MSNGMTSAQIERLRARRAQQMDAAAAEAARIAPIYAEGQREARRILSLDFAVEACRQRGWDVMSLVWDSDLPHPDLYASQEAERAHWPHFYRGVCDEAQRFATQHNLALGSTRIPGR